MIRTLLVYAGEPIAETLQTIFRAAGDLDVVEACANAGALCVLANRHAPDVLAVELVANGPSEFGALRRQLANCSEIPAVLLTQRPKPGDLTLLLNMGAKGIVVMETAERDLIPAIHAVYEGHWYLSYQWRKVLEHGVALEQDDQEVLARLTPREWQVFRLLALGCSTAEVAAALDIARKTVSVHRSHLLNKLRLKNNAHLACLAAALGLLHE